jgi:endonuclease I
MMRRRVNKQQGEQIMRKFTKFATTGLLLLSLVVSLLSFPVEVQALSYSTSSNSGTRDQVCTSLSGTGAASYYTGSYTYDKLSSLQGGTSSCLSSMDSALFDALHTLMTSTMTNSVSYSSLTSYWPTTDGNMLFYSDFESTSYNREHVWPKSLGGFGNEGAGADLHHVRPDDVTTNAVRGNLKYGNVEGGTDVAD